MRLPEGVNTKATKLNRDGTPYKCRMLEWHPERRTSLKDLAAPFGIDLNAERRDSRVDGAADIPDHPLLNTPHLEVKEIRSAGRFDVTCPWVNEHTGQADDGAAIFTNEDGSLGFKCHHGVCQERTGRDLMNNLEAKQPGFRESFRAWQVNYNFKRAIELPVESEKFVVPEVPEPSYKTTLSRIMCHRECNDFVINLLAGLEQSGNANKSQMDMLYKQVKKLFNVGIAAVRADVKAKLVGDSDSQTALADLVINAIGRTKILYAQQSFYLWKDHGVWCRSEDIEIKREIHLALRAHKFSYNARLISDVLSLIKTEVYLPSVVFDARKDILNTSSGELSFDMTSLEWNQHKHDLSNYCSAQIPVKYDASATAHRFQRFLSDVFEGAPDSYKKAIIILEMIGYSLMSHCRFEKFIMLVGNGANGKSVLLGVIEALVGSRNVCAVQPDRLDQPFSRAHLKGKYVNIVTELAEGGFIADQQLKALSSGDLMTAEYKMQPPFEFHPFATCWFGTNHLPSARDFSGALFRRAIVLEFPNTFNGERRDPDLLNKLKEELPGILNLALDAYGQVLKRGHFTECQDSIKALNEWKLNANQVAQFLDEMCVVGHQYEVEVAELYMTYRSWASTSGIQKCLNKKNFGLRLDKLSLKARRDSKTRYRVGLTLNYRDIHEKPLSFL